jgi:hypothetical protein
MKIEGLSSNALEPSAHPSGSSRTLKNNKYSASIIMQAEKLFNTIKVSHTFIQSGTEKVS